MNYPAARRGISRIVTAEDKGLTGNGYVQSYDAGFPKYRLYPVNFWDYDRPWYSDAEMYFQFPDGVLPEVGMQTVKISIEGELPTDPPFEI